MKRSEQLSAEQQELAEKVRQRCIEAAKEGFRDASIQGLCREGTIEAAVSSIERLDLNKLTCNGRGRSE